MASFGQYDCDKLGNLPNFLLDFECAACVSTVLFASKWSYFGSFFTMGSVLDYYYVIPYPRYYRCYYSMSSRKIKK